MNVRIGETDLFVYVVAPLIHGWRSPLLDEQALVALDYGTKVGRRQEVINMILAERQRVLTDQTRSQRSWQTRTSRRPRKARHHDSIQIREQYVRCHRHTSERY